MKKITLTIAILIFFTTVKAQTNYYVSLSGNDNNTGLSEAQAWRTITFAASSNSPVSAGDVVHIKAGNYGNENVAFQKSGTNTNLITFEGYQTMPKDNPTLNYAFGNALDAAIMPLLDGGNRTIAGTAITLYSQQYILLKNLQITNYQQGVDGWNASNNTLENIIAIKLGDYNANYDGKGFSFTPNGSGDGGDNNTLKNCIVSNACAEGISIVGDNNILENCKIYCNEDNTVHASMDYYIVLAGDHNYVKACYIERFGDLEHGGAGIGIKEYGEHNLFENCIAKNLENGGFYVRWAGVRNNEFRNCKAIGTLADVNGFLIRDGASFNQFNSCVSENCSSAIRFSVSGEDQNFCGRNNSFNNCIIKNATWAIEFIAWAIPGSADNNLFSNCVFDNITYLFESARENHDNRIINCIVKDVSNLFTGSETLNFGYTYSNFHNNGFPTPVGIGNISTNPQFVDEINGDFHLKAGSLCIDAGTSSNAPSEDYEGVARPQGAGFDIGAYEFQNPLAVEYLSPLLAIAKNDQVLLKWISAYEKNNDFFLIERSQNTLDWKTIGRVEAKSKGHTSQYYKAYDNLPPDGNLYYRLKQFDFDGTYTYSNIASVSFRKMDFKIQPNPTTSIANIIFSDAKNVRGDIIITDITGKQFIQQTIFEADTKLNLSHLPNGVYLIYFRTNGQVLNRKLILQK